MPAAPSFESVQELLIDIVVRCGTGPALFRLLSTLGFLLKMTNETPISAEHTEKWARFLVRTERLYAYQRMQAALTCCLGQVVRVVLQLREKKDPSLLLFDLLQGQWEVIEWAEKATLPTSEGLCAAWKARLIEGDSVTGDDFNQLGPLLLDLTSSIK